MSNENAAFATWLMGQLQGTRTASMFDGERKIVRVSQEGGRLEVEMTRPSQPNVLFSATVTSKRVMP